MMSAAGYKQRGQPTQLTSQLPDFLLYRTSSLLFNHSVLVFDNNESPDITSGHNVTDSDVVCCEWKFVEKVMM